MTPQTLLRLRPLTLLAALGLALGPLLAFFAGGAKFTNLAAAPYARTLLLAALAAAGALALGLPAAWALAGSGTGARWLLAGALAVLLVPPYLACSAWLGLAGRAGAGFVAGAGISLLPEAAAPFLGGGNLLGAAAVLAGALWPCPALAAAAALAAAGRDEREAALLARGRWGRLAGVELPAALPAALAGTLLAFALAAAELGVADLYLVNTAARDVLKGFESAHDYADAAGRALPLAGLAVLLGAALSLILVRRALPQMAGARVAPAPAGWLPRAWTALLLAATLGLVLVGLAPNAGSLRTVGAAAAEEWPMAARSLVLALLGAAGAVALGAAAVWALAGARGAAGGAGAAAAFAALAVPLFVPGTLWGLGLLRLREASGAALGWLFDGPAVLVWSGAARGALVAAAVLEAARRALGPELLEAGRLAGLGAFARLRLAAGLLRAHLLAALLLAGALALGEVGAAVLIAPPGWDTLPVWVFAAMHNAHGGTTAALALLSAAAAALLGALTVLVEDKGDARC